MKKNATCYCAGPAYCGCGSTDVARLKQTGSSSNLAKPSPIISLFLEIGQKKTVDKTKFCGGAENVVKTETQQTFVNGLLGFTLGIYTPLEARVYCFTIIAELPIDMGNSIW